ncbi:MAG: type II toxin-antitoxin system VapC family toxin [Euryarchaeota archaeon]|nr:type II toxin-antitoxin system VapC family toxin [Euryarchaeota archaeon]
MELSKYVDSNIFFYAKILDAKYGEACANIIQNIEEGKIKAAISTLVILEVANALRKYGFENEVKDMTDAIYSLDMVINDIDYGITREAIEFYEKFRISSYDCLHIATMRKLGVTEIISADKDFDKIPKIKRIDPIVFQK